MLTVDGACRREARGAHKGNVADLPNVARKRNEVRASARDSGHLNLSRAVVVLWLFSAREFAIVLCDAIRM